MASCASWADCVLKERAAQLAAPLQRNRLKSTWLFEFSESLDLGFQRLVVLALDLKFGLEFFDKQLQSGNFHAQLLQFVRGDGWPWRGSFGRLRINLWLS